MSRVSVWVEFTKGRGGVPHQSPRQSEDVGVCLGGIHRKWRRGASVDQVIRKRQGGIHQRMMRSTASVAQAIRRCCGCLSGWHSLPRKSVNVVGVCLGGIHRRWRRGASVDQILWERRGCLSGWNSPDEEYRIRRPGSPETSWVSVWLAFVAQAVGNIVGVCLGGIHCRWRRELLSTRYSGNVVDVCLAGIHWRRRSTASITQAVRKRCGCLGGIRCPGSPGTSWVSVWVAFNGCGREELSTTRQSGNVVDVCLSGFHRRRSTASVAHAVRERRGCLFGWHSLPMMSGNVVGVCLGGIHGRLGRGASVD